MKKKNMILAALACVMVLGATLGSALAYFTTYVSARGGVTIEFGGQTEIHEDPPTEMTKHVVITAKEDSDPVWVRARGYAPDGFTLDYSGEGWTYNAEEDFAYYAEPISKGGRTKTLDVHFNIPEDYELKEGTEFNIVVIYEATPYIEGQAPDWNATVDTGEGE